MSRNLNTHKTLLVALALGLGALGSTTMPAAARSFSPLMHSSSLIPMGHSAGPSFSRTAGSPIMLGNNQPAPNPYGFDKGVIAGKKLGGIELKVPVPQTAVGPKPGAGGACEKKLGPCKLPDIGGTTAGGGTTTGGGPSGSTGGGTTPGGGSTSTPGPHISIQVPPVVIPSQPVYYPQQPVAVPQPVYVPRPQVVAAQPQQPVAQAPVADTTTATQESAGCLSKQYLANGTVVFRDSCTQEAAIATPAEARALAQAVLQ